MERVHNGELIPKFANVTAFKPKQTSGVGEKMYMRIILEPRWIL